MQRHNPNHRFAVSSMLFYLLLCTSTPVLACDNRIADQHNNPCPLTGDIDLPMPQNGSITFRKISVPQSAGDINARGVWLGSANGNAFERPRNVVISGSFPDRQNNSWYFLIGKYEVTLGQYLTFEEGTTIEEKYLTFRERIGPWYYDETAELTNEFLAQPVAAITRVDIDIFMHRYNRWCLSQSDCLELLPVSRSGPSDPDKSTGYFRLPTELEWEYSARGGSETVADASFRQDLPFPPSEYAAYAYVQDIADHAALPIGSLMASYGLHDMLGNVSEIVMDSYQPFRGYGDSGATTVRGGSFDTHISVLKLSRRSELPLYRQIEGEWEEERQSDTGFRLAIGAPALATTALIKELGNGVATPIDNTTETVQIAAESSSDTITQTVVNTSNLSIQSLEELKNIAVKPPKGTPDATRTALQGAIRLVEIRVHQSCVGYIKLAGVFAELLRETNTNIERLIKLETGYQDAVIAYAIDSDLLARYQKRLDTTKANLAADRIRLISYAENYTGQIVNLQECGSRYGNAALAEVEQQQSQVDSANKSSQKILSLVKRHFQGSQLSGEEWIREVFNQF